jgi:hypothetical protein
MPRKKDKNRTVQTKYRFTMDELTLIVEALLMFRTAGSRIGLGFTKADGSEWNKGELVRLSEDDKQSMLESGEIRISPVKGQPLDDWETELLDELFETFNDGLGRCEEKIEEADAKIAEENIDNVIKGFYDLLKDDNGK